MRWIVLAVVATGCYARPDDRTIWDMMYENDRERAERLEEERLARERAVRDEAIRQETEGVRSASRAQAITLHERAVTAARKDDCDEVSALAVEIRSHDVTYHDEVVYPDRVLAPCLQPAGVLTRAAEIAARASDCSPAFDSHRRVHRLDPTYHEEVFRRSRIIEGCWALPDRATDAKTLRYAQQARNAARRLDCRAARLMLGKVKAQDAAYHRELVGSTALEGCR